MPDAFFPVEVPAPCSMLFTAIGDWYRLSVGQIPMFIDLTNPDEDTVTDVWGAVSRLRYAGAMSLYDPALAPEFFENHPLPSVSEVIQLARRTAPDGDVFAEAIRLLLNVEKKSEATIRVVNYTTYSQMVLPDAKGEMCVMMPGGWQTLLPVLPPRPVVPNPEYLADIEPFYTTSAVWADAPSIGDSEDLSQEPCILVQGAVMLLAYWSASSGITVVKFFPYIEHQETRIGELLESHPYFNAGLKARSFNLLSKSLLTRYWSRFPAQHWVVNFSDRTLDIVAWSAEVLVLPPFNSTLEALNSAAENVLAKSNEVPQPDAV